ncbi:MAG: trehalose-6-phosphate synthase, partial [Deltaproteobacteria bacterium]|nr:trehalose-6-phosphate synthase [Deltaproteobacteria bacterium]
PLASMLTSGQDDHINQLFERVATADSRVVAVGVCKSDGEPSYATKLMPSAIKCAEISRSDVESFSTIVVGGRRMLIGAFPISADPSHGHFIIVQDLTFAEYRGQEARNYLTLMLGGIILASGALAVGLVLYLIRNWTQKFKQAVIGATVPGRASADPVTFGILDREVRQVLRQLEMSQSAIDRDQANWSKSTLRDIVMAELPGVEVLVVANREPYIHNRGEHGIELQTPASGLVSAVEPVMRACGGTWIAHGSGTADRETVDAHDRIAVPPGHPEYTLRRIWITEEEQDGYYYGLANEGRWPLCHIAFTRPVFRESDWRTYRAVNERFADAVVAEAKTTSPIVLVQDYHFALAPKMIRQKLPRATILTFWHIPWPSAERVGICPWGEELISGMLGSSILGFHTQQHCNNFIDSVDAFVESRIDRETNAIVKGRNRTLVRPYPISIEWPVRWLAGAPSVAECRAEVRRELDLPADALLGVGIDRLDYTKGIEERLAAVDSLLERYPEYRGRFTFAQLAAPSRTRIVHYRDLNDRVEALSAEINARWASGSYRPIALLRAHHEPAQVFRYYRAADLCYVSSLDDGMNLVAKEFAAARDDERGVLVLSQFTGAARDLTEALIVNPYDLQQASDALAMALRMAPQEQRERMRSMRRVVAEHNVYRWAGRMLVDAASLRRRERLFGRLAIFNGAAS